MDPCEGLHRKGVLNFKGKSLIRETHHLFDDCGSDDRIDAGTFAPGVLGALFDQVFSGPREDSGMACEAL